MWKLVKAGFQPRKKITHDISNTKLKKPQKTRGENRISSHELTIVIKYLCSTERQSQIAILRLALRDRWKLFRRNHPKKKLKEREKENTKTRQSQHQGTKSCLPSLQTQFTGREMQHQRRYPNSNRNPPNPWFDLTSPLPPQEHLDDSSPLPWKHRRINKRNANSDETGTGPTNIKKARKKRQKKKKQKRGCYSRTIECHCHLGARKHKPDTNA